jgi:hypothetical protein
MFESEVTNDVRISSSVIDATPKLLRRIVQEARRGFAVGLKPEFVLDGSGGTYFLHDPRKVKICVFKPADEEPYAENNPRGYLKQPGQDLALREGVVPGEACIREVAAFMLDHEGFSGVPMTTLAEARHPSFNCNGSRLKVSEGGACIGAHSIHGTSSSKPATQMKVGSFQEFVRAECTMDDISPSMISVDEVHKIAILDIRLMNADRNSANLLCRRKPDASFELVPIDHGFCLRSVADVSWMDWCWLDWPQLKEPLSTKSREYILKLDIEADVRLLRERLNIRTDALDYFRASSSVLKEGVKAGLTLYEIADMCCRNDNLGEVPSKLEVLFSMASELANSAIENGRWHHSAASTALAEQLSPKGGSLFAAASSGMHKSLSAACFVHAGENLSILEKAPKKDLPGMIQSSASDSSSDTGDADHEDCEEWAAAVIMDVSLDKSFSMLNSKKRSTSNASDSSSESGLSCSPQGFWHIRPGSSHSSDFSDDASVNWSPRSSPTKMFDGSISSFAEGKRESLNDTSNSLVGRRESISVPEIPDMISQSREPCRNISKVSFAESSHDSQRSARFAQLLPGVKLPKMPVLQHSESSGLTRSQSYSALSNASEERKSKEAVQGSVTKEQDEQYRDYFLKFVDLVMVREITSAAHHAKRKN